VVDKLEPKGEGSWKEVFDYSFTVKALPGQEQAPNPAYSNHGTWKPCIAPYGKVYREINLWRCRNRMLEKAKVML